MNIIKKYIGKYSFLYRLLSLLKLILSSSVFRIDGSRRKYPKVIQLPITYRCNSRCVMCGIWQQDHSNEMNTNEFSLFLRDPIFRKVEAVGINGGEPSLLSNLPEYANEILKLPKIKSLNVISHGFSARLLLHAIEEIYKSCRLKKVHFHITISLDGFGEIHDRVRGRSNVFDKTIATIDTIVKDKHKYCDSFDIACTVVKQNIDNLIELDVYAKMHNLPIKYRLGVDNKRIKNEKLSDDFSVINGSSRQSAKEFFFYQAAQAKAVYDKFKYFSIFYWLVSTKPKRLLGCIWKDEGITMDSRGDIYYCAVVSEKIGRLRDDNGESIFWGDENIEYRKSIIKNHCDKCIHDYAGTPELKNLFFFLGSNFQKKYAMLFYKYKCRFGLI